MPPSLEGHTQLHLKWKCYIFEVSSQLKVMFCNVLAPLIALPTEPGQALGNPPPHPPLEMLTFWSSPGS